MSKKFKNEFKERLQLNRSITKAKSEAREKIIEFNRIIQVDIGEDIIAKVDRGNYFVNQEDIKELIKDLFYVNSELKENSIINLDEVCDVFYRLNYKGIVGNEAIFQLC